MPTSNSELPWAPNNRGAARNPAVLLSSFLSLSLSLSLSLFLSHPARSVLGRDAAVLAEIAGGASPGAIPASRAKPVAEAPALAEVPETRLTPRAGLTKPLRGASGNAKGRVVAQGLVNRAGRDGCGDVCRSCGSDGVEPALDLRVYEEVREISSSPSRCRKSRRKFRLQKLAGLLLGKVSPRV